MVTTIDKNYYHLFKDDPVRPKFSAEFRTGAGKESFVLIEKDSDPKAVLCCAFTNEVPITEQELDIYSQQACQEGSHGSIAVFYTVWSYAPGAGRRIIFDAVDKIKSERPRVNRFVTLSPLTKMAERFHLRNGAVLLQRGDECQNFEYSI